MGYRFKDSFRSLSGAKAGEVAEELDRIKADQGSLTAASVMEASRPDDALLHDEFVWDGAEAIRKLGILRAASIIRAVVVVPDEEKTRSHRVWIRIADEDRSDVPGHYEKMDVVVRQVDLFERAVTDLQRKFDAAAEALEELRGVATGSSDAERLAAIGLAVQGFGAVREALAILR